MLLVFDVGNTETTIGLCEGDEVRARWRARAPRRGSESTRAFLPVSKYVATLDVQLRLSNADFECPLSSPAKPPLGDQDSCNQSASTLAFVH